MTTLILKSDKDLKKILTFAEENGIKVETKAEENKSPYNPEFVKKIRKREKNIQNHPEKLTKIKDIKNIWESIL